MNGRSADQTFYYDYWSKIGNGFGHEARWALQSPSRGTFRTYVFQVKGAACTVDAAAKATSMDSANSTARVIA